MLTAATRFRPNTAEVAAKVIDGEAILMNLSNGLYYSLADSGAALWELLECGYSLEEMGQVLSDRYGVDRSRVLEDADRLMGELLQEGLVQADVNGQKEKDVPVPAAAPSAYAAPVLNKYSDMADLLALDPPMPNLGEIPVNE
jgi:Coenzyme PQQ synthesis protein D (PqqD)